MEMIKDYTGRDYRTVWEGPKAEFEDRFETAIIRRLLSPAPGWFLDLGAGYGRLQPFYARPGRRAVLVDYAVDALQLAAQNLGERDDVHYVAANAYHLPFRAGAFDAGISIRTYHHMNLPERFLEELGRTLGGGARFLVEYSNKRNALRLVRYGRRALRRDHEHYGGLLFGSHPRYFAELCLRAGLEVVRSEGTGFMPRVVERVPAAAAPLGLVEWALDAAIGGQLAPMTFADVAKRGRERPSQAESLLELLCCPACGGELDDEEAHLACGGCGARYPRVGAVVDLRHPPDLHTEP
ncbi:MAG: methyltransferase domain-containing protein [Gaiellaceae bacterium]